MMFFGKKRLFLFLLVVAALPSFQVEADLLEENTDEELEKLISQEQYVVVLFCEDAHDSKCEEYETELAAIREDLVDSINAWVVKAIKSSLRKEFNPDPAATIVFFRKQSPVLYDGPANEEILLETLYQYKEQCIQDLSDNTFEHLTQAATGATTGDWLIHFLKDECEDCQRLEARMETVACKHKGRINVARVNKGSTGAVTSRRFEVGAVPALIFFRLGKMYRYELERYDVGSISSFITGFYKNVQGSPVPLPKSPFDDLVQMCVDYIRDYPLLFAIMIGIPVLLTLSFFLLMSPSSDKPKSKKKKKKDKEKDKENKKET